MALYSILILALVQGITEFLPISSSGHLILVHALIDNDSSIQTFQENLLMDVAVHVGTLFSVLVYFRHDVATMMGGVKSVFKGQLKTTGTTLNLYLIVSSVPVIIAGFALNHFQISWLRTIEIIGWTTLIFGILLWIVDAKKPTDKTMNNMTLRHALWIGLAQSLALVPGTSRSGITMTMARFLGYSRTEAARYSILLAIIAIGGAGTLKTIDLIQMDNAAITVDALIAAALAFLSGWAAISLMMKWLSRASFKIFAIYRVALGLVLLGISYWGALA